MAQTKFDKISVQVSADIGDEVVTSNQDGTLFSALDRLNFINKARGLVYSEILHALKEAEFLNLYPEFLTYGSTVTIHPIKAPAIRKMIRMYGGGYVYTPVPAEMVLEAMYNQYSTWYATATKPRFTEQGTGIVMLGVTQASTISNALYLAQPVDVIIDPNSADIFEPATWIQLIINMTVKIMKQSQQINQ